MRHLDIVEVTCPKCGVVRKAQLRDRGFVRLCPGCGVKKGRSAKKWASIGTLHMGSFTPLYRVWNAMKQRCDKPTCDVYKDYGGRGISYVSEWSEFVPFRDWAMSNGYSKGLLLDRIDNDGNYGPSNCRWIESFRSALNRRTTKRTLADVAVMKSMYEMGIRVGLISALYGLTAKQFCGIREKATWKRIDPLMVAF